MIKYLYTSIYSLKNDRQSLQLQDYTHLQHTQKNFYLNIL